METLYLQDIQEPSTVTINGLWSKQIQMGTRYGKKQRVQLVMPYYMD